MPKDAAVIYCYVIQPRNLNWKPLKTDPFGGARQKTASKHVRNKVLLISGVCVISPTKELQTILHLISVDFLERQMVKHNCEVGVFERMYIQTVRYARTPSLQLNMSLYINCHTPQPFYGLKFETQMPNRSEVLYLTQQQSWFIWKVLVRWQRRQFCSSQLNFIYSVPSHFISI